MIIKMKSNITRFQYNLLKVGKPMKNLKRLFMLVGVFLSVLTIIILFELMVSLSYNLAEKYNSSADQEVNVELEKEKDIKKLEVKDVKVETTDHQYKIVGLIRNILDHDLESVSVTVSLYDKDDNKIGEACDYSGDLKKGSTWKFEAVCFEEGIDDFDVKIDILDWNKQ